MARKKKEQKKLFCIFCGTENEIDSSECKKCKKSLHPKNELLKDFLYNHIRSDLKGKVEDNIFSYLKNYIISHLYGFVMSLSVVFTVVTTIIALTHNGGSYTLISDVSEMTKKSANSKEIVVRVYTYDDSCAADFDATLSDVPFMTGFIISGNKRVVQEVTLSKGTTINNWCKEGHEEELICKEELGYFTKDIEESAKKYRDKVLEYAAWVHTYGTSDDETYMDYNFELEDLAYEITPDEIDLNTLYDKDEKVTKSVDLFVPLIGCEYEGA